MLLKNNTLPNHNYGEKKFYVQWIWSTKKKIHACPDDCVLYIYEFVSLKVCPTCGSSLFKKKLDGNSVDENTNGSPLKVVWYLPIIPKAYKRQKHKL